MTRRYFYAHAEVLHIVDGDTIDVEITWDVGFKVTATTTQRLRLARINTPETNRTAEKVAGQAAEEFVRALLTERSDDAPGSGSIIAIETFKDDGLSRYVADIWTNPDNIGADDTLNDRIVEAGHAQYKTYGRTQGQPRSLSPWSLFPRDQRALHALMGVRW